ncbi:hypothetical protein A4G19_07380 [Pasteurellaceae bacterium Macca]|nr:hypothetical protein [Pasteurellaceae bacterium Macca]
MRNYLLPSTLLALAPLAFADTLPHEQSNAQIEQKVAERLDDQRIQDQQPTPIHTQSQHRHPVQTANTEKSVSMSKAELAQHPDLLIRALLPALMQSNDENVALLYPIYQQIPQQYQDPTLSQWAQAIVAKSEQDYGKSIHLYRELLAKYPDHALIRLQLAMALTANNELEAAEDQFKKLRSEVQNPQDQAELDKWLEAINRRDRWTFSGGLTYLNDPNINNAPKAGTTYGRWTAPKRESAQGIGFNLNVGKKWSWGNGFFNELRLNSNGKYYWDNRKYNEITNRGSFGIGFQNAKYNVSLAPFMEQTLYAGGSAKSDTLKRFSKAGGVSLDMNYWFNPKWQLNGSYEYSEQRYTQRKHLNGNAHFGSLGLVYVANAKQYWFSNLSYQRTATRDKDDSYFRRSINLGWGQEWGKGLSSRLSVSYGQKRYKAPMPIFQITQRNKELGFQASVWHRAIHWKGITPRLTYNFTRTRSNHVFYSYDKHRLFLEFSKHF